MPGDAIESGLSAKAAEELGLLKGTAVGTSLIDAHAGALGMIGCYAHDITSNFSSRLGTQNIHNTLSCWMKRICILLFHVIFSFDLWHFNVSHDNKREKDICKRYLGTVLQCDDTWFLA